MSKLADKTRIVLKKTFPHNFIIEEYYINYKGMRLFFDFYIKELDVLVEVQGQQHDRFIKHFHQDQAGFIASKKRDNLKKEYCEEKDMVLLEIRSEKHLTRKNIVEKIWSARA